MPGLKARAVLAYIIGQNAIGVQVLDVILGDSVLEDNDPIHGQLARISKVHLSIRTKGRRAVASTEGPLAMLWHAQTVFLAHLNVMIIF